MPIVDVERRRGWIRHLSNRCGLRLASLKDNLDVARWRRRTHVGVARGAALRLRDSPGKVVVVGVEIVVGSTHR
jgi:hypothetical protein